MYEYIHIIEKKNIHPRSEFSQKYSSSLVFQVLGSPPTNRDQESESEACVYVVFLEYKNHAEVPGDLKRCRI